MALLVAGLLWKLVRLIRECHEQMKTQLAAASRIQTAWRNRAAVAAAPTPPGEPVNDLRLALEAHTELKAHEARSATRKPLRPRN